MRAGVAPRSPREVRTGADRSARSLAGTGGNMEPRQTTPGSRFPPHFVPRDHGRSSVALGVAGFAVLRQRWPEGSASRLAVLAAAGFVLGAAGAVWGTDQILGMAGRPGTRRGPSSEDGPKFLAPYALPSRPRGGPRRRAGGPTRPRPSRGRLIPPRPPRPSSCPVVLMPDLGRGWARGAAARPVPRPTGTRVAEAVAARPGEGSLSLGPCLDTGATDGTATGP